jgi:hypothetical protein
VAGTVFEVVMDTPNGLRKPPAGGVPLHESLVLMSTLLDLAEALRDAGIDPHKVEVSLPTPEWKELHRTLAREQAADLFEGVSIRGRLNVGGVRYLVRFPAAGSEGSEARL